jgi:adenylylsulfate kinase-like enzyme
VNNSITPGTLYWITGLPGAGKTTVANLLADSLWESGGKPVLLDGDTLRSIIAPDTGYSITERRQLAMSYAGLSQAITLQGVDVICSTVSMFHAVRDWNRENVPEYFEVFLRVTPETLRTRDQKGLYSSPGKNVYGLDIEIEEPLNPDLIIDNEDDLTPDLAVARILRKAGAGK